MTVRDFKMVLVGPAPTAATTARASGAAQAAGLDRTWSARAACIGVDPDELFVTGAAQRDAARLCRSCPVRLECLADALDSCAEFGVWGGLTERQRRALLRRRPEVTNWRALLENARRDAVGDMDAGIQRVAG